MAMRDKTIDRLRGIAMVWVIVVHVLYWGFFFENRYIQMLMSLCLFEMPLFFFVTGAANSFSRTDHYLPFVYRRFKRVLIPYWVFALICAFLSIVSYSRESGMDMLTGIKILLSWLIPADRQMTSLPYLTWALWFVPVYLCVVVVLPPLMKLRRSAGLVKGSCLLGAAFVLTCLLKTSWLQSVTFYTLWTYIGLFYSDIKTAAEKKPTRRLLGGIAAVGTAVICCLYFVGVSINMQHNKFPPNLTFGLFSLVMMSLIMLVLPRLEKICLWLEGNRITGKLFYLFSNRSMTVFLYQVFAFSAAIPLCNLLPGSGTAMAAVKSLLCFLLATVFCAILAVIFGRIENLGTVKSLPDKTK